MECVGFFDTTLWRTSQERASVPMELAITEARRIGEGIGVLKPDSVMSRIRFLSHGQKRAYWQIDWRHGHPTEVIDERVTIQIEAEGKVMAFFSTRWTSLPKFETKYAPEEAVRIARMYLTRIGLDSESYEAVSALKFVHPNNYWETFNLERKVLRPVQLVRLTNGNTWMEAWVDIETGQVIGGDRSR